MEKEPTNKEIMGAIEKLGQNVGGLQKTTDKLQENADKTTKSLQESIGELHEAINVFASHVDERFEKVDKRFEKMESRMDSMESKMVTKDYLDEKLFDLRGDMTSIIRKEDKKVESLIEVLYKKKILSKEDKKHILQMEPFPKSA